MKRSLAMILALCFAICGCSSSQQAPNQSASAKTDELKSDADATDKVANKAEGASEDREVSDNSNRPEHEIYHRFLNGELSVRDNAISGGTSEQTEYDIEYFDSVGLSCYYFYDLDEDGSDEMLLFDRDRIMHLFSAEIDSNELLWLGNLFYTGCTKVGVCSDRALVMFDSGHPGREVISIAKYLGGDRIEYETLFHEFDDPMYHVENEVWTIDKDGSQKDISEEEFENRKAEIRKNMIDVNWRDV